MEGKIFAKVDNELHIIIFQYKVYEHEINKLGAA